ncbi:MAG: hypothetical protein IKO74_11625 [Selenomonadaceae bacterium]|nr:hypothetical protein [Selenomonadaceae bacterium]
MPADSPHKEELIESVTELFNSLWIKNADKCRFNSLVERFTSGLMEALIRRPLSSTDYPRRILRLITKIDRESRYTDFFAKIFLHDNVSANLEMAGSLKKFLPANREVISAGISFAVEALPFGKWAKMLLRA